MTLPWWAWLLILITGAGALSVAGLLWFTITMLLWLAQGNLEVEDENDAD